MPKQPPPAKVTPNPASISLATAGTEWPQWAFFLAITMGIAFAARGQALDNHWTTSWVLLSGVTLILGWTRCIRIVRPSLWAIGMVILLVQALRGGHCRWEVLAQLGWLWTWLWTVPNPDRYGWWKGIKALPIFALLIGGIMLAHALGHILRGEWDHGATYSMSLPWAHRNIAMESLFAMGVLGALHSKQRWWGWWGFITVLALVYQVRGVLLGCTVWMLISLWSKGAYNRLIKWAFFGASAVFISAQVAWNAVPQPERVRLFAQAPDVLKTLDVMYNLKAAESSSIRLTLWHWTVDNCTPTGAGLAAWRNDIEGWSNVALNRCGEAQHRAHSELLQWGYEIGWLPLLVLIGLSWPLRHSMGRWVLFVLPFLAFTFPSERAEILWPLAVLGWWFKWRYPPTAATTRFDRPVLLSALSAITLLMTTWMIAQNALGNTFRQTGGLKVDWSTTEEMCIGLHPQDIALNHADLFRGMSDLNAGKFEEGSEWVRQYLEHNPRSIPGIKILQKMKGLPNDAESVCNVLAAKLASSQDSAATTAPGMH